MQAREVGAVLRFSRRGGAVGSVAPRLSRPEGGGIAADSMVGSAVAPGKASASRGEPESQTAPADHRYGGSVWVATDMPR
jgi:hypothetical protein